MFGAIGALVVVGALVYRPAIGASTPRTPTHDDEVLGSVVRAAASAAQEVAQELLTS